MKSTSDQGKFFLISNMWPDKNSPGYGSFVKNVTEGLESRGWVIGSKALIVGKPAGPFSKLMKYVGFYLRILKGFWRSYDFIYIHFPNQAIPILRWLYKFKQPSISVNFHGEDLLYSETGYLGKLGRMTEDFCKKYVDTIVVPSSYYADIVADRGLAKRDDIIVSPSGGISSEIFYPESNVNVFDGSRPVRIGYVGRLEKEKGILIFIEMLKQLKKNSVRYEATIVGYGSLIDHVRAEITDSGLDGVTFIPGMPQKSLGHFYRKMDLIVFPSYSESLGLVGIESMACGVPVIGSSVGGIRTYLKDGINGYLAPVGDVDFITGRILTYISLPYSEKLRMRENCISIGKEYYMNKVVDRLSDNLRYDRLSEQHRLING